MIVTSAPRKETKPSCAARIVAIALSFFMVVCFMGTPFADAYAAGSKSASASSDKDQKPLSASDKDTKEKNEKKSSKEKAKEKEKEDEEEDEESKEERERREHAEEMRASADAMYAQARTAESAFNKAQAKYEEASDELDAANEALDAAKVEFEEKSTEIVKLQDTLSDYVVDMYKQGGTAPYLDVMLRSTSYREFLTSWNMTVTVSEYGRGLVAEKKQLREEIENKVSACEKEVKEAEREKTLAEANRRQLNATRLAFLANAAEMSMEAAKLEEDDDAYKEARAEYRDAQAELEDAIKEGLAGESVLSGTGYFTHPCPDATVSSGFGYRSFDNAVHKGLDLAAPEGTPYYAADSGTVTAATNGGGDNGGAGNWIVIDHGNGLTTKYMHSLVTLVSPGDHVERGQNIGLVGNTGQSFGAHLHFQVESNGVAVNPVGFL